MSRFFSLLLIGSIMLIGGCDPGVVVEKNSKNGKSESEVILKNGKLQYKEYYPNGKINNLGEVDKVDNKKGKWKYYHSDGRLKAEGEFRDDYKEGIWKYNFRNHSYQISWTTYLERPVKISIPESWKITKDSVPGMPLFAISDNTTQAANFNIFVYDSATADAWHFISDEITKNASFGTLTVISRNEVKIKEKTAYEVVYNVDVRGKSLISLQYFIPASNKIYLISFFVPKAEFDKLELLISEIAFSFSII